MTKYKATEAQYLLFVDSKNGRRLLLGYILDYSVLQMKIKIGIDTCYIF
jgi:hypothetical protein